MARNLYRFYLYSVFIALLVFAAVAIGLLLNVLLAFTFLKGSYDSTVPSAADVVQAIVLAVVAFVIAGALAGLHYWLIRRDILHHPEAGASAIRSFFLNITSALGVALAVPMGGFALDQLARSSGVSVVSSAAFVLPTLLLVGLLALERQRTQAGAGAALVFQRLHFYGIQVLLLIILAVSWFSSIRPLVDILFFAGRGAHASCSGSGNCLTYNPFFLVASLLWVAVFWVGYGWFMRKDTPALLRLILHGLGLAYGIGFVVYGLYQASEVLFLFLFGAAPALEDVIGLYASHDIVSPLAVGIFVVAVYHVWLRMAAKLGLIGSKALALTEVSIITILAAGAFWWGGGITLYNGLEAWMPLAGVPKVADWASSLGLILAGVGYIPLGLYLRRRSRDTQDAALVSGPRRGYVLALFGGGVLALAIGGAIALYSWITFLFHSPINSWQQVAHTGLAAGIVGALLVAIYLPFALRERLFSSPARHVALEQEKPQEEVMSPTAVADVVDVKEEMDATPVTIEGILDELVAGKITREEAASRIRAVV